MRSSHIFIGSTVLIAIGGLTTLAWTQGQERVVPPPGQPVVASPAPPAQRPTRDLSKWPHFSRQIFVSGNLGNQWLQRANDMTGRFVPGYVPALRVPLEGESYLRQAGAAFALAKAARYYNDSPAAAKATQAILTLLLDTAVEDPKNPTVRVCTLPAGMANHLAAAAVLVQAIHELPSPPADLLDQADQLCNAIRRAQRTDGSLACHETGPDGKAVPDDNDAINNYTGEALYAVIHSHQQRPAPWKVETIGKAMPYYQAHWRANKNLVLVPRLTATCAEAFLVTNDKAYADFVFEMNDWLCTFQFVQADPQHLLWIGGFMTCVDGRPMPAPPHAGSALYAQSLAEAARVARKVGDVQRWERYKDTLTRSLQFLMTMQYTEANSPHFVPEYRQLIVGGFYVSHQDGNIRLDSTQHGVCAMIDYLLHVGEAP